MRYLSTRGEAPPLGFAEAMLAGLARDGGLYVPQSWPRIEPHTIMSFAGRPYAEVAVEIVRRFADDSIGEADLARMAREAYGNFRHPAVVPLTQLNVNTFALELFHGPTLAFKDLAMQLLARLMDHVLAARGERRTIVVATSGDTGGAASRSVPRARPGRSHRPVSAGAHLRRATAHDDDGAGRKRQRGRRSRAPSTIARRW